VHARKRRTLVVLPEVSVIRARNGAGSRTRPRLWAAKLRVALSWAALSLLAGALPTPAQGAAAAPPPARASEGSEGQTRKRERKPNAPPRRDDKGKRAPLSKLGSISVGAPHTGFLFNAVRLPAAPDWAITVPTHAYGTEETVEQLAHCVHSARAAFPGSPRVMIGSLSKREGGEALPHKSHRTGRDADVYFFRHPGANWHEPATPDDIDLPRTWALLRCFVSEADVDFVLIDASVQAWLEEYALTAGEPEGWVASLFHDGPGRQRAVVRHEPGHADHMHVRFVSAGSRQRGRELYDRLVAEGRLKGPYATLEHRVRPGDTLSGLAHRYKTTVERLQKLNRLGSAHIRIGQKLTVSRPVPLEGAKDPIAVPPRRTPPSTQLSQVSSPLR
jgi:hypothetical protein